ncbi:MAG: YeeE/YedE family protein [Dehalococcoidia bacterium]|nr:YeeE/YedE family protein [Dehalococcoidia bacterium]
MRWTAFYLVLGAVFGLILSRSGAADYNFIQGMFLFEEFQLYGIIGTAVVILAPSLYLLKRRGLAAGGRPLVIEAKPGHRGNVAGGLLFGVGWSITGMCPGPVLVNVGEGKLYALAALAGVLVGASGFGIAYPKLIGIFRLPPLEVGTGEG